MGGADPRSLPLLICPSRAVVSPNADGGAPLQPQKPLCSLTSQPSGGKLLLSAAAATCWGGTRRGRSAAGAPFLLRAPLSRSRPGARRASQPGARPAWLAPKRRCLPGRPRPPASRGARSPHPSPRAAGRKGGEWSARAPPAPPRRRRGSPCSASLAGREPRGSGRRAADLLWQRAAPLSSEGGSSSAAAAAPGAGRRRARLPSAPATPTGFPRAAAADMDLFLALVLGSALYLPAAAEFDGR